MACGPGRGPSNKLNRLLDGHRQLVGRHVGDAIPSTLSSHVRRARRFQSAVHCPASFLAAPIGADLGPSHMDPGEEAGTAASLDHITERLQSLEDAAQLCNISDLLVVVNVRSGVVHRVVGDPSNPAAWQTCPVLEQQAAVTRTGAVLHRSIHTLGRKQERGSGEGREEWEVRWSVSCARRHVQRLC